MKAYVQVQVDEATLREQGLDPQLFSDLSRPVMVECRDFERNLRAMGLQAEDVEQAGYTMNGQPVLNYHVGGRR